MDLTVLNLALPRLSEDLERDPDALLDHVFATWPSDHGAIPPRHRDAYDRAMTPETIAAMCADYRASFHADHEHDIDDRAAGRRIAAPVLVVIGDDEAQVAESATLATGSDMFRTVRSHPTHTRERPSRF